MKPYIRRLWGSQFARNVAVVAGGTAGAQIIAMISVPVITRLYGPEAYGLLGTFIAVITVIAPLSALSYPRAIVLPKEDSEAQGLVRLTLGVSAGVAALVFVIFGLAGGAILEAIGAGEISQLAWLVPLAVLFTGWVQIAQQWLIRQNAFRATARVAVTHSFLVNGAKAGAGFSYPIAGVLIALHVAGVVVQAILLWGACRISGQEKKEANIAAGQPSTGSLARKYRDFPLYRAPQKLINAVSHGAPVIMLAGLFGPASAGFYALGRSALGLPSRVVAQSVGTVFYPRITEAAHDGNLQYPLILKATLGLAAIGVLPFAIVFAFGPSLFGIVFGWKWTPAGEYARWLSLMYFFYFINRPSVQAVPVLNLKKGLLIYEILSITTKLLALYIGFALYESDLATVALFSVVSVIAYASLIVWVLGVAGRSDKRIGDAEKAG